MSASHPKKFNSFCSYISQYFTLEEGDLILTGTPAGVGPGKYLTIEFLRNLV
jgi:2-keto-4-pentenoate hydratase/2-oxohepta-3-ene-1,7-dioic acid hydratase in catechol pathway